MAELRRVAALLLTITLALMTGCGSAGGSASSDTASVSSDAAGSSVSEAQDASSASADSAGQTASGVLTVSDLHAASIAEDFTNLTVEQVEENTDAANFLITDLIDTDGNDGYRLIELKDGSRYLVVPASVDAVSQKEGILAGIDTADAPDVLQGPVSNIYLAATSAMSHFARLDAMDALSFSGTKEDDWYIDAAKQAMADGNLLYAGKYSAPDYETLVSCHTSLAIESTMILHTPDVKEKLIEVGIPVLTDLSSYEDGPLGRMEWIRVYGALTDRSEAAEAICAEERQEIEDLKASLPESRVTAAYFSLDSTGQAVVRKSGDYIAKMIEMAGGSYVFSDLKSTGSAGGTTAISMEEFYADAKDADVMIYNASIEGQLKSTQDLVDANPLFAKCAAVESGEVYMALPAMYQATDDVAQILTEMSEVFQGTLERDTGAKYFKKVA